MWLCFSFTRYNITLLFFLIFRLLSFVFWIVWVKSASETNEVKILRFLLMFYTHTHTMRFFAFLNIWKWHNKLPPYPGNAMTRFEQKRIATTRASKMYDLSADKTRRPSPDDDTLQRYHSNLPLASYNTQDPSSPLRTCAPRWKTRRKHKQQQKKQRDHRGAKNGSSPSRIGAIFICSNVNHRRWRRRRRCRLLQVSVFFLRFSSHPVLSFLGFAKTKQQKNGSL